MKEIKDIITAYKEAVKEKKQTALATVVKVEGSSYRRPGARMLIREDGLLTGAISGGCLEGDALRKALQALQENKNKLVIYDTNDEGDAEFGLQLGCNGKVYILFEPIEPTQINNPIQLLEQLVIKRSASVFVTLFYLESKLLQPGSFLFTNKEKALYATTAEPSLTETIKTDALEALHTRTSTIKAYDDMAEALIQYIPPTVQLIIAGAGNDAQPLVGLAQTLGWNITVTDGRPAHVTVNRFPQANLIMARPADVLSHLIIDSHTAFVLMTHNYNYDKTILKQLINKDCFYVGILGPKKKLNMLLDELKQEGIFLDEQQQSKIYGPVGLDIGAETAEEIAVSVIAEIKSVLEGCSGTSLKNKPMPIHHRGHIAIVHE